MNKEKQQIAEHLERFFNGESTIEEEDILGRYFATHEVADEWLPYKQMFAYFDAGMSQEKLVVKKQRLKWLCRYAAMAAFVAIFVGVAVYMMLPTQTRQTPQPVVQNIAEVHSASEGLQNVVETNTANMPVPTKKPYIHRNKAVDRKQSYLDADSTEINWIINANVLAEIKVEEDYALLEDRMNAAQKIIDEELSQLCAEELNVVQVVTVP